MLKMSLASSRPPMACALPIQRAGLEVHRIQLGKHPPELVVVRNPAETQETLQPRPFRFSESLDLREGVCTARDGTQRNDDQVDQAVIQASILPDFGEICKDLRGQSELFRFHLTSLTTPDASCPWTGGRQLLWQGRREGRPSPYQRPPTHRVTLRPRHRDGFCKESAKTPSRTYLNCTA